MVFVISVTLDGDAGTVQLDADCALRGDRLQWLEMTSDGPGYSTYTSRFWDWLQPWARAFAAADVGRASAEPSGTLTAVDKLATMEVFVRIVETGSFSAVARELGLTQPTVSKQLTALERELNTRLLNRSTRSLSLTEAGAAYYERCRRIIDQVYAAEVSLGAVDGGLTGTLSVNSSVAFGQMFLTHLVLEFQGSHPQLSVRLTLNDRYIDLIEEGIDVAVRFGRKVDTSLVAHRLADSPLSVVASQTYVQKYGAPAHPSELSVHRCLHYTYLSTGNEWVFPSPNGDVRVRISGTLRSNNGYALRDAMLAGQGIAIMPQVFIQDALNQGYVVRLLEEFTGPPIPVNAVYPSARSVSVRVRAFVDFLQERLREIPGLAAPPSTVTVPGNSRPEQVD